MKLFFAIISTVFLLMACNKTGKQLKEKINNADSIAINYFKGDGTMDTVMLVKIIKDKNAIGALTEFVTQGTKEFENNCGFDGSLHFFKMNQVVQDIDFRMGDNCRQFFYKLAGEYHATELSGEAKKLLLELKK